MDLRKLRYFVGIVEAGGFRRAARRLNIAQPALSRHIRELEAEIGLKLLERGPLGVCLTAEGQQFLAKSRDIIDRVDNLATTFASPGGPVRGSVRIGAPTAVAAHLFGPLAHRLHDSHPEVHLKCITDTVRVMDLLAAGDLDLGIVTLVDGHGFGADWVINRLAREQDYLLGPAGSLDESRAVSFDLVMDLPLVLTPMPHSRRSHMQVLAAEAGRSLDVVAEAGAIAAQASFVRQGLGYAVMPYSAASLMKSGGPLAIAPIVGLHSWRVLVRRSEHLPSQLVLIVSEMIIGLFKNGIPSPDGQCPAVVPFRAAG